MAKKSRGCRMKTTKIRAPRCNHGGKGSVKNRPAGKRRMRT